MASLLGQACKPLRSESPNYFIFMTFWVSPAVVRFFWRPNASSKNEYLGFCVLWRLLEGLSNNNPRQEREDINTKIQREQISGGKKRMDLEHLISVVKQSTSYLVHPGHRALFWPFCALCKKKSWEVLLNQSRERPETIFKGPVTRGSAIDYRAVRGRSDILKSYGITSKLPENKLLRALFLRYCIWNSSAFLKEIIG